jgi:hypothetical protein
VLVDLLEKIWSNLGILVPIAGFIGVLLGVALIHRSTRSEADPIAQWRYRDLESDPSLLRPRLEERRFSPSSVSTRADLPAARRNARALLIASIAMPVVVLLLWVMQPGYIGGMFEQPWYEVALPCGVGALGYLVGLGWMIRIYRADPEPDEPTWRYRD